LLVAKAEYSSMKYMGSKPSDMELISLLQQLFFMTISYKLKGAVNFMFTEMSL
jgi:hypothetical protein